MKTSVAACAGRQNTYQRAKGMGIQLKKQWLATLDGKTRHEHRMLDGQTVEVEESFRVDGYKLKYPGDPSAPRTAKLGEVSYEEWKAGKQISEGNKKQTITDYSQNSVDKSSGNGIIVIKESLKSGKVSVDVNKEKQNRHIKSSSGYTPGRSYIYGSLEDAQILVNKLTCTGTPIISSDGEWQKRSE